MFEAGNVFMEGFLNSNILFYIQHINLKNLYLKFYAIN